MFTFRSQPDPNQTEEFKELLRRYGDVAYRMAYQLTRGNETEANDLVQEVFIRIWRRWSFHRPNSMKAWMYRILSNLHVDAVRHKQRNAAISIDSTNEHDLTLADILPDHSDSPERSLEKKDLQNRVRAALEHLEEDFRIPIVLCDMEGLAYEDIARILACPIGTVRSRIHRGRLQLRQLLQTTLSQEVLQ